MADPVAVPAPPTSRRRSRSVHPHWRCTQAPVPAAAPLTRLLAMAVAGLLCMACGAVQRYGSAPDPTPGPLTTVSAKAFSDFNMAVTWEVPHCATPATGQRNCPITRQSAIRAAQQGGDGLVLEAQLANVSLDRYSTIGHDRLLWLVVISTRDGQCQPQSPAGFPPGCPHGPAFWPSVAKLILVDAYTGIVRLDIPITGELGENSRLT